MSKKSPVLFFSGFPGFIASKLIDEILDRFPKASFHFVVLQAMAGAAATSIADLRRRYPETEFKTYIGDITLPKLGLNAPDYDNLVQSVTDIFHLAAVYDLSTPKEIAHRVNVIGTENMLKFGTDCKKLKKFVYYSTCYVAGKRTGRVYEQELEKGQQFKNHYESTKYLAEVAVRSFMDRLPIITIRPSIVVGDSRSGETIKFDGPYFMMKFIRTFSFLPMAYIGESQAFFNVVPVDYVIKGSVELWQRDDNDGTTYALADPAPLRAKELYDQLALHMLGNRPVWTLPHPLVEWVLNVKEARTLLGIPVESLNYLIHEVEYDCSNATRDLAQSAIACPPFPSYAAALVRFFQNHADNERYQVKVH